ncbi:MAG TPA: Lrp/AsnC family transcriptional regulator [Saprospiraceae bacterium]|nr:Lrp/AsnC family transcriptional regulator [Saprospiraceae bacterium]
MANSLGLDKTDLAILRRLQKDNRATIKQMAAELNLSTTPIFERLRKLEQKGYIKDQVAVLDPVKLDLKLTAFISISISDHSRDDLNAFADQVVIFPEVLECHHVSGQSDFILKVVVKDIEAYNQFLLDKISTVPNISNIESSFALSSRKVSTALPI